MIEIKIYELSTTKVNIWYIINVIFIILECCFFIGQPLFQPMSFKAPNGSVPDFEAIYRESYEATGGNAGPEAEPAPEPAEPETEAQFARNENSMGEWQSLVRRLQAESPGTPFPQIFERANNIQNGQTIIYEALSEDDPENN